MLYALIPNCDNYYLPNSMQRAEHPCCVASGWRMARLMKRVNLIGGIGAILGYDLGLRWIRRILSYGGNDIY
jgi:hypothetical protein